MTPKLAGCCVLVVEDEYFLAEDMRRGFEKLGATVLGPTARLEEAMALAEAVERIDAAVLDIKLSDGAVYPLADALHARGVPFVFTTGYDKSVIPKRYAKVLVLQKPVDPEAVIRTMFG